MNAYILRLPAAEVVRLLRAETESSRGQPELNTTAGKEYLIEEEFDCSVYGIPDGDEFDLITSVATLTIEPRVESGYWILETAVERPLGPLRTSEEDEFAPMELTLDEFEAELRSCEPKGVSVRLYVQTAAVKQDFDRWLAEMQARHPLQALEGDLESASKRGRTADTTTRADRARERATTARSAAEPASSP
jgi:hypothetical protein